MASPPPVPAGNQPDFPALTSLRWLAALLVFVYHFPPPLPPGLLHAVVHEGHVGVGIFFVLSGFLITLRYFDAVVHGRVGLREYFTKRFARILPLYWTVLALTLLISDGTLSFGGPLLAEWTVTQGFFRQVFVLARVPTSWSLTVEECFYAAAPLVFLTIAALDRRRPGRPLRAAAAGLGAWMLGLLAVGVLLLGLPHELRQRFYGFFGDTEFMVRHTLFGRFVDFALGAMAAVAWRESLPLRRVLMRPGAASTLALAGLLTIVAGEWLMEADGGIVGETWVVAWRHSLLVSLGSAALILGLTRRESLAARALGVGPLVYAGKISYALYLIQLTPLGKGLLFPIVPPGTWAYMPVMYVGMTAVSAALYELVEHPAHRGVLRLAGYAPTSRVVVRTALPWAAAVALALTFGLQMATALTADVSREEALGVGGDRVMTRPVDAAAGGFRIPESWLSGPDEVRRSPPLLLWLDGTRVTLGSAQASYRSGHRGRFLALSCEGCREATVVRDGPGLRVAVAAARLVRQPASLLAVALSGALVLLLARRLRGGRAGAIAATATALLAWFAGALHDHAAAAWILAAEVALLAVVAGAGHAAAPRAGGAGAGHAADWLARRRDGGTPARRALF